MHGENEQNLPPTTSEVKKSTQTEGGKCLPESFKAFNACGTATCGAGRSKNTASAHPFSSSVKPNSQTSRWYTCKVYDDLFRIGF